MIQYSTYSDLTFDELVDLLNNYRQEESVSILGIDVFGNDSSVYKLSDYRFKLRLKFD